MSTVYPPSFSSLIVQSADTVARQLLGWKLEVRSAEGTVAGIIVETESYSADDPASHSYRGITQRNAVMFGPAGRLYVYFTYGMHYCINVVTGNEGQGEAVLLRALEPVEGLPLMRQRRSKESVIELANGPAKLAQACGLNLGDDGSVINASHVHILPGQRPKNIMQATRVGITKAVTLPRRYYVADSPFVSRRSS